MTTPSVEPEAPVYCAAHPDIETELRCSRCETPICPRCMVMTPVGARCRACARLRRPPMYEVGAPVLARAVLTSLIIGAVAGIIWGLILPHGLGLGLFDFLIAFIVGSPLGYGFANLLDRVTNRKRGPLMQGVALAGLVTAWLVHAAVAGGIQGDLFGIILIVAACTGAVSRLR